MRVYEVMSKAVETVRPKVAAQEAKTRMRLKNIHHLVVTDGGKLQGIVTVSDLLDLLARKPEHKSNREVRGQEEWNGVQP